ncbi:DUF5698 domain-containing protein, partial [Cytobacillus oceanisediminis]
MLRLKGEGYLAGGLSMMEVVIYVVGVGVVVENLNQIEKVVG